MALKAIVDNLDSVPEQYRDLYSQKNGKYEFTGVEGLKTQGDVDRLQQALNKERGEKTALETQLRAWGDHKPETVIPILDKIPELEAAAEAGKKKLDEKQIEAIVNGRLAPLQRELDTTKTNLTAAQKRVGEYEELSKRRTISDAVRAIAAESKALPEAYKDEYSGLMLLAGQIFTVDAQGQVVVKEGAPGLTHGTRAQDVLGDLQRSHPYFWPQSTGGGASGNTGSNAGTANPFKGNNMTDRSVFIKENSPDKVNNAMKAAGLTDPWQTYKP